MIMRRICIILINELAKVQASRLSEGVSIQKQNNSKSQAKPRTIPNSKLLIPNSLAVPPKTIFAFLTLNTMS